MICNYTEISFAREKFMKSSSFRAIKKIFLSAEDTLVLDISDNCEHCTISWLSAR